MAEKPNIDELMDKIVQDDAPAPVQAAAPDESAAQPAEEAHDVEHDEGDEAFSDPAPVEPKARSGEAEKALKAAKVAGLPASMLEAAKDEELVAWHHAKLKNDADVRRTFQENAELTRKLAELEGAKAKEREPAPAVAQDFAPSKELVELFGEEEARAIAGLQAPVVNQLKAELEAMKAERVREWVDYATDKLTTEGILTPELPDDARQALLGKASRLEATGDYEHLAGKAKVVALLSDAAKLVLPAPTASVIPEAPTEPKRSKGNGTVTPAPSRKAPPKPLSTNERIDKALSLIVDEGVGDVETLNARLGSG